ncbi:hypothetical protein GGI12_000479 [Dipsacomyces acuminosporus]|nr:hypothetical protein GGI12_000479 [Dipsacomyces acuminosporus]
MPLSDDLDEALYTYVSPEARPRRQVPSHADFARRVHSYEVLNQYVVGGNWRALALASQASILETPALEERTLLKYWVYRILALTELHHFEQTTRELHNLERATSASAIAKGTCSSGRSPTVVWPFELRVMRALVPGMGSGDVHTSIDRLNALIRGCQKQLQREGLSEEKALLFKQRLFRLNLLLIAHLARLRDSALAAQILDGLVQAAAGTNGQRDPHLLSAAARLYLQLGNVQEAERLFVEVEKCVPKEDKAALMNRALYAVATGKWDVARSMFATIFADHPERIAAGNNMAICDLYLGNPQAMLNSLQQLMTSSPTAAGTSESLVFNYCTGLDLHYDGPKLRDAKIKKMVEVGMWAGDGFDMGSFKHQ